ncbi:polysaccharide biosynthesis protein [Tsuneonella troitsensis]|uniref:polysaccharide biosynthesis protein n=1 Tax=Tsuneonella troitsensis TaxID=292222 RepID=UPI0013797EA8|nr:nucleoside-diphosphate sugar epimerase/dehydratase [Tsuneonella troitsensis]
MKRAFVLASDATLCAIASVLAYGLRVGAWAIWNTGVAKLVIVSLVVMLPVMIVSKVYSAIFRYAGRGAFRTLLHASAAYSVVFACIIGLIGLDYVPRTTGFIQPIIFFGLLTNSRLLARYLLVDMLNRKHSDGEPRSVLIYGAGSAGQRLASSFDTEPNYRLAAYVDDDPLMDGQRLDGVPVVHSSKLEDALKRYGVSDILLSLPELSRAERRTIVDRLSRLQVHVQVLPPFVDLVSGQVSISDMRELDIDDLLGREPVPPMEDLIADTLADKRVLVTGAGGSIGSDLCRQILAARPCTLILVERSEYALYAIDNELRANAKESGNEGIVIVPILASVTDAVSMDEIFARHLPETVFHAAAYKHVPLVEANPVEGVHNNVIGTRVAAECAGRHGARNFILISTDKAVRPTNVMGASKRASELIIQALAATDTDTIFSMVRFGNVLGSSGSVVPLFRAQIVAGGPITLTHREVMRYFMTIPEAAQLVLQAAGLARGGEVFVLDMGESVKIGDLARSMVNLSGLSIRDENNPTGDIEIVEVGLRPGEKMYEELLIGDNPEATAHQRILKATEASLPWDELRPILDELAKTRDEGRLIAILHCLVPGFAHDETRKRLRAPG